MIMILVAMINKSNHITDKVLSMAITMKDGVLFKIKDDPRVEAVLLDSGDGIFVCSNTYHLYCRPKIHLLCSLYPITILDRFYSNQIVVVRMLRHLSSIV